jgi:serine/threonine protein kinase
MSLSTIPTVNGASARGASEQDLPNAIGKYHVLRQIGQGAMGVVYECLQTDLDRRVALKVLNLPGPTTHEQIRRFEREARAAARLSHPNVVQIFDVGSEGGRHYLVMEFVDGVSLDELIGTGYLTLETSLRLLYHLAQALAAAHEQGIIHRDLKPSNILVDRSGRPRIADFGLAKSVSGELSLSGDGDLIGTPRYMSPEQVLSSCDELDGRSDVFSLGAVMYEMLAGRPPFDADHVLAILRKVVDEPCQPLAEVCPALPRQVTAICERALAKDRENRYASAAEMAGELRQALLALPSVERSLTTERDDDVLAAFTPPANALRPPRRKAQRWPWLVAAAALVLVSGAALASRSWLFSGEKPADDASAAVPRVDYKTLRAKLFGEAQEQLSGPVRVSQTSSPRDGVKAVIEDLTVLLKQAPDDHDVRKLRGRAYRRGGECLAAVDDFSRVIERRPDDLDAVFERLLANYQLYVLYLGDLNLAHLRLLPAAQVNADVSTLRTKGNPQQRYVADLIDALARQDLDDAEARLDRRPATTNIVPYPPDLHMLEADLLLRAARRHAGEPAAESQPMLTPSQRLGGMANRALRKGLDADPNHVGLLFLKANSIQQRADWEDTEGEGRDTLVRRNRAQFDAACDRLRLATLRAGCDTSLARAVLLTNIGWDAQALDQVQEALSCRPTVPHLYCVKAWLRLFSPEDGTHTPETLAQIMRDLEPAFESAPEEYNPLLVRALVHTAAGRWDDARRDLKQTQRLLGGQSVPDISDTYRQWIAAASGPLTLFFDQTRHILSELPVPQERRVQLLTLLLGRLADNATAMGEGLSPEQVKSLSAWAHFALAEVYAGEQNRAAVLDQARLALDLRQPDLTPQSFREHGEIGAWNDDADFVALYKQFEPSAEGAAP